MRPLIPKVRLGDVLHGTRHLRHYLRAISVLNQLVALSEHNRASLKTYGLRHVPPLYVPRKDDQFVTAVNADSRFAVWSTNGTVVLLFVNPTVPPHEATRLLKVPHTDPGTITLPAKERYGIPRMDATVFSKWFVRTAQRRLDTASWPPYAHGLRMCFHHNLINWGNHPGKQDGESLHYTTVGGWNGPFTIGEANKSWAPVTLEEQEAYVQHGAVRGTQRPKAFESKLGGSMRIEGLGPSLALLPLIRKEITRYYEACVEKGTIKRARSRVCTDGSHPEADILGILGDLGPELLDSDTPDTVVS